MRLSPGNGNPRQLTIRAMRKRSDGQGDTSGDAFFYRFTTAGFPR